MAFTDINHRLTVRIVIVIHRAEVTIPSADDIPSFEAAVIHLITDTLVTCNIFLVADHRHYRLKTIIRALVYVRFVCFL